MRVLYLDSLFVMELAADLTLLWAAGKLCAVPRRGWRLLLAALLGAGYAVLAAFWLPASGLPCKAASLSAMLLLAYGGERRLLRLALAFLCMCAVYGGVATAVALAAGTATLRALIFSLGLSLGICALPFRFAGKQGGRIRLRLEHCGRSVELTAFLDTGNRLQDPVTGAPVAVVGERELLPLLDADVRALLEDSGSRDAADLLLQLGPGFRLLPYRTLGGSGLLLAFRPERAEVNGRCIKGLWAALSPEPIRIEGCEALLNGEWNGGGQEYESLEDDDASQKPTASVLGVSRFLCGRQRKPAGPAAESRRGALSRRAGKGQ